MSDFNYNDSYTSSSQQEYQSKMHDSSVETQGRRTYIFKLDKNGTEKSELYNEAKNGRLYLPHFEQRALYNTNEWTTAFGTNGVVETEETLSFEYNFARMVYNIRDLKDKVSGVLEIKNISNEIWHLVIEDGRFLVKSKMAVTIVDDKLSDYKSVKQFIASIENKCSGLSFSYTGNSEEAKNISNLNCKLYPNRIQKIDVTDKTYENCADVIEEGDIILTDRYKLYQVQNVYPSGNTINDYISWTCKCNTCDIALANLPDDYRKIVTRNQYALPKTKTRS